ncbi:MAG: hypothetical protein AABY22_13660 [Nanoarchaeota archaeon]
MNKKIIFTIIFIIIGSLLLTLFINNYYIPARASYNLVCNPEIAEEQGLKIIGATYSDNITGETTIKIFIDKNDPQYNSTLKHENCHLAQNNRLISFPNFCGGLGISKTLREVECYISEDLPEPIYKIFYGNYNQ